jgi:hypothetical protein
MTVKKSFLVCVLATGLCLDVSLALAAAVTVTNPFYFRENRGANDVGQTPSGLPSDRLVYGAGSVVPNGDAGTTGTRAFGANAPAPLPFNDRDVNPNQFSGSVGYTSALAALPVNLVFTNGANTTAVSVAAVGDIGQMPLPFNLSVSGIGTNLTFHWADPVIPSGLTLERGQIEIFDVEDFNASGNANVLFQSFLSSPSDTSFAVPGSFSSGLLVGHHYAFGIRLEDLRSGVDPSLGGPARLSSSQAYLDFTPTAAVPEPETYAMLLAGLGLMGLVVRRKRKQPA